MKRIYIYTLLMIGLSITINAAFGLSCPKYCSQLCDGLYPLKTWKLHTLYYPNGSTIKKVTCSCSQNTNLDAKTVPFELAPNACTKSDIAETSL